MKCPWARGSSYTLCQDLSIFVEETHGIGERQTLDVGVVFDDSFLQRNNMPKPCYMSSAKCRSVASAVPRFQHKLNWVSRAEDRSMPYHKEPNCGVHGRLGSNNDNLEVDHSCHCMWRCPTLRGTRPSRLNRRNGTELFQEHSNGSDRVEDLLRPCKKNKTPMGSLTKSRNCDTVCSPVALAERHLFPFD